MEGEKEVNKVHVRNCADREDSEMSKSLPGYGDFRRYGLPGDMDLAAISNKIYGKLHKPYGGTL